MSRLLAVLRATGALLSLANLAIGVWSVTLVRRRGRDAEVARRAAH